MKLNWGKSIFIFILFFLSICTIFIIFSLRQDNDLVTENYYNEGASYTTRLEVINRSQVYFDSINIMQREDHISFNLAETLKPHISELDLWFYRPSGKSSDFKTKLKATGDSLIMDKSGLKKGRYILKIKWVMNSLEYAVEKDIFINQADL